MISCQEYQKRRKDLIASIPKDSLVIVPAAVEKFRNADTHYPFRQNSDFLYLTGFLEPDAILVLSDSGSILFNQAYDAKKAVWTGAVLGQDKVTEVLGVDKAYPLEDFENVLMALMLNKTAIYYPFLQTGEFEKKLFAVWKKARAQKRGAYAYESSFHDVSPLIAKMRLFKSPAEIACLKKAIDASVTAHLAVMKKIKHLSYEYEAAAIFHHSLQMQGFMDTAYPSIVGSGANACTLHYTQYDRKFLDQDLLLIDAGAEFNGYAADITRTYPVRGQWSGPKKDIYTLVLEAQTRAIDQIKIGNPWTFIQQTIVGILTQGLIDLGILKGSLDTLLETKAYQAFYMHNSGHWLGLDVHDVGAYENVCLKEGMVLTVEPGLYIPLNALDVDERFRGIGVRIEDDIHLDIQGAQVLSGALPKTIIELAEYIDGH